MRAGTVESQVKAFQDAMAGDVMPPAEVSLTDEQMPIWLALVRARARDEWSEIDKFHCANLTRCLADIERISRELGVEGDTLTNERGTRVMNPKHGLLDVLSRRAVGLTKLLHLHAATIVEHGLDNLEHKREQERLARENAATVAAIPKGDDDLLARPSLQ